MGQVLHRSATTTEAVRRAIQNSQESPRALSALWHQTEDGGEVEDTGLGHRSANRTETAPLHCFIH